MMAWSGCRSLAGLNSTAAVQATVQRLIDVRQTSNRNITNELRQVRDYKNPDFLQKMVKHFGVRDKGSCFPKDVFDPDALPREDFYTACVPAILPADPQTPTARPAATETCVQITSVQASSTALSGAACFKASWLQLSHLVCSTSQSRAIHR